MSIKNFYLNNNLPSPIFSHLNIGKFLINIPLGILALFFLLTPVVVYSQTQNDPVYDYYKILFPDVDTSTLDALKEVENRARNYLVTESISLVLTPPYPGPNQDTSVKVVGSGTDLLRAEISWYLNGSLTEKGTGKTVFSFRTKKAGSISSIRVSIKTLEGIMVSKNISVNPADIELLWESDGYVPPFYKGKAMATPQSNIKIVAVSNFVSGAGNIIDPDKIIYLWKDEEANSGIVNASGYAKKVLLLKMPSLIRDKTISVNASSLNNSIQSNGNISILPSKTTVLFYENSPLNGVQYAHVIKDGYELTNEELSIKAEPYYFSKNSRLGGDLNYSWKLGSKEAVPDSNEIITFKQEGVGGGAASVSLVIRNISNILQQASASFVLNYK